MKLAPLTIAVTLVVIEPALAAEPPVVSKHVREFLAAHCAGCHGAVKPKGGLRLDDLSADFADAGTRDRWMTVRRRVAAGEMPPKEKPRPSAEHIRQLEDWVVQQAGAADVARRAADGR